MADLEERFREEKRAAREYQERRHDDWKENYELYRNSVRTNQLTQRQAVNVPLMKETVKTLLSKIDDAPMIDWKEKSGDEFKEIVMQEKWNQWIKDVNAEGVDIQDKKVALMYGRPHKKLNWVDGGVTLTTLDPYDLVIDPMTDPLDIETAGYVVHQNIFRTLRQILANPRYTAEGKRQLKKHMSGEAGIVQSGQNLEQWQAKMERLEAMGVEDTDFANFSEGDQIVSLTEHITQLTLIVKVE